ncbi:SufD family Fe-S cluster assembly protein [bacterium]|nr:SufD family Fe-S cluster assembly protein [bacterium]
MALKVGDKAPEFKLKDSFEKEVSLSDFKGKRIILYFYPKDNTPGCTKEACNFKENWDLLQKNNIVVLGISKDNASSHQKFIEKFNLPFILLTDPEPFKVSSDYDSYGLKKFMGLKINGSKIPPIEIFSHAPSNSFNAKTLIIFLEKNCDVELLQVNLGKENSSLSQSTFFCLKENSSLNHGVVSYGENRSNLLNSLNVIQQKNSSYNLGSLHFKFNYARFEISIKQSAGNAKTTIKGMQITKKDEQISTYTKIEFNGPNGFLDQINKSLADDESHAIFEGSIIVPKIAQRTDASQLSRNLLLSNLAQIDTKPQLEIIADDVKCKHGATISQLNEEELFYMRTRGITLTEASKLQLSSYFQEIISFIPISKDRWDLLDKLLNEN